MVEAISLMNLESGQLIDINQDTSVDYVLQEVDWGVIQSNHFSYKYVNQIGVQITGTSLETRDVSIVGWVVAEAEGEMTRRKDVLNKFINPTQAINLYYKEFSIVFMPLTSIRYSVGILENNKWMCKFKIDGIAPDPLFSEDDEEKIPAVITTGQFHFPLIIARPGGVDPKPDDKPTVIFGLREPSLTITVTNEGAVPVGMRIEFIARGSTANPQLINVVTGEYFKIEKSMVAGERIIVDSVIGQRRVRGLKGVSDENYYPYIDLDSTWLELKVGDNIFSYDASNQGALEVYVYFYNKYLEVQQWD